MAVIWAPEVAEVGALLRARTVGDDPPREEVELGTFDETTRPTGEQVALLIEASAAYVATRVGSSDNLCEDALTASARELAALRTAMSIELSYYPEQIASNKSPYREFKELYDEGMKSLTEAVSEQCGGGGDGDAVGGTGPMPSGDFGPYDSVGRDTIW